MNKNLLVIGNSTMPKNVGIWNLPPAATCRPSPWCRAHCFARKGNFTLPSVQESLAWRFEQSKRRDFVERMVDEITRLRSEQRKYRLEYVRIHIAGDFYSAAYVRKWALIALQWPCVTFRTNTRRQDLIPVMWDEFPDNVVVRESWDKTRKPLGIYPLSAVPGTPGTSDGSYYQCIDDCKTCRFYCWHHAVDVRSAKVR